MNHYYNAFEDNDAKEWFEQWLTYYHGQKHIKISNDILKLPPLPIWYDDQGWLNPTFQLKNKVLLNKMAQFRKQFVAIQLLDFLGKKDIWLIYQRENSFNHIVDELKLRITTQPSWVKIPYMMSVAIFSGKKEDRSQMRRFFYKIDAMKNFSHIQYDTINRYSGCELVTSKKERLQMAIMGSFQLFCHYLKERSPYLYLDYYRGIRPVFESLCEDSDILKQFKGVLILGYIRQSMMGHHPTGHAICGEFIHRIVNTMISPLDFFIIDDGIPFKRFNGYLSFFHKVVKDRQESKKLQEKPSKKSKHCLIM